LLPYLVQLVWLGGLEAQSLVNSVAAPAEIPSPLETFATELAVPPEPRAAAALKVEDEAQTGVDPGERLLRHTSNALF
jgi:hypothetical protein